MPYALVNTSGDKEYHKSVLQFLEDIENVGVKGVVMVAITDEGPFLSWCSTPLDFATAASVVQAQATQFYLDGGMVDDEDCD